MGFTHRELFRALPSAVYPYECVYLNDRDAEFLFEHRKARLTMSELRYNQIAALRLPVIDVKIEFENFSEEEYESFINKFKKYLHKGGG